MVGVVNVKPAIVAAVPPKDTDVLPIVTLEFVRLALAMLDSVFDDPLIVLLVRVSVVARPTKVSLAVGSVKVPVFEMVEMIGAVNVLFVRV